MSKNLFFRYVVPMFFLGMIVLFFLLYTIVYSNSQDTPEKKVENILISEIKPSGGTGKTTEEYIELYNPLTSPVDISGWVLARQTRTASSSEYNVLVVFTPGISVPGGHFLLVAHQDYAGEVAADIVYGGTSIADDNTIILMNTTKETVDLVGYGKAENFEIQAAPAPTAQLLSIERLKDEIGVLRDTNNNALDFVRSDSSPQNLTFSTETVTGTVIEIVSPSSTEEEPVTPTSPSPPVVGSVLITELLPVPTRGEEFVELYNRSAVDISLIGWWLEDGSAAKTPLVGLIAAGQYLIVEKPKGNLNNAGDTVSLKGFDGSVIDDVAYGESQSGFSFARIDTTYDNNDSAKDFALTKIVTPGAKNQFETPEIEEEKETEKTLKEEAEITDKKDTSEITKPKLIKETKIEKKESPRLKISADKSVDFNEPAIFDASESIGVEEPVYVWDMGDGTVKEGEVIDHLYLQPGYFVVTVTMTDIHARRTKKLKIEVKEARPKKEIKATVAPAKAIDKPVFVPINALDSIPTNTAVTITGIVAAEPDSYNKNKEFYLIDEVTKNGVRVAYKKERPAIVTGDRVTVTGKYTVKPNESYLTLEQADYLVVLNHDSVPTPQAEKVSAIVSLASGLVRVSGEITEAKKDYAFIADKSGEIKINGLKKQKIVASDQVDVTGVLVKTKDGLELHPRTSEDVVVKQISQVTSTPLAGENKNKIVRWQPYAAWGGMLFFLILVLIKKLLLSPRPNDGHATTME